MNYQVTYLYKDHSRWSYAVEAQDHAEALAKAPTKLLPVIVIIKQDPLVKQEQPQ